MTKEEYEAKFKIPKIENEEKIPAYEKALELALDIRKFEIDLYWKRATYFWTFIAATFAGYAIVYKVSSGNNSWLLLVFSCLGFLFSIAWYLANRGSKFWQNNWERHVDLLEDHVVGPLYKTVIKGSQNKNPLTSPAQFSVSKINQILSVFISVFWSILIIKSLLPISPDLPFCFFKTSVVFITFCGVFSLFFWGKSEVSATKTTIIDRSCSVKSETKS